LRKNKKEVDADAQRKQAKPPRATKKTKKRTKHETDTEKEQTFRVFKELAKPYLNGWTETPKKGQKRMDDGKLSVSGDSHPHFQETVFSSINSFIHPSVSVSVSVS